MGEHNQQWVRNTVIPYLRRHLGANVFQLTVDEAAAQYRDLRKAEKTRRKSQKLARRRNR